MVYGLDSNATGDNYNPDTDWGRQFHWWDRAGQKAAWWDPGGKLLEDSPDAEAERQRRALLNQQAAAAGGFANQGQQGFASYGQQGQGALDALRRQANGENSVSQLQLRQALQQQLAQQRSMAAGASPRNAGMAARTAAIQMGRASTAAAGQQSLAGLQERNQAQNNYAQLLQGLRQQDLQAALESRRTATGGFGAQNAGQPEKTNMEKYGPAISSGLAAMFSDRALKTNVQSGDSKANAAMDGLKPYTYAYKDQALGAGPQVGVMAGDVRKVIPQAVITVPDGPYAGKLALDPGKLSGANTAMIAALNRRVQALEGPRAKPTASTSGPAPTVGRLGPRPGETPDAALTAAFGTYQDARAENMADWARTVGMDPDQVSRDAMLQQHLARRVNDYKAASPQEKLGMTQIWGLSQRTDDERAKRERQGQAPSPGGR